jgi:hypothetical protein
MRGTITMSSSEERLKALTSRFSAPSAESKTEARPKKSVERRRHSLYLDKALVARADQAYKDIGHELYPVEVNKSDFLEACLDYALSHLEDIKATLAPDNV